MKTKRILKLKEGTGITIEEQIDENTTRSYNTGYIAVDEESNEYAVAPWTGLVIKNVRLEEDKDEDK